jgi:hypothetical protein
MAWLSLPEDKVYYQVSGDHGLSWSTPQQIPDIWGDWTNYNSRTDSYAMATDSAGNIHLVMAGRLEETEKLNRLLHLTWDGEKWLPPETIVSYKGDVAEWPRIAVSNGNQLNVSWFVRTADTIWLASPEYYKVYYSRSRADAPYVAPKPWPTVTPIALVTPTAGSTAVPTNHPTDVPPINATLDSKAVDEASYTEAGQINVVALSVIPAAGVILLLLVIILIRRR